MFFLSYLYKQPDSEKLLFKGGTALKFIFRSPRYSEDLDFTGINITQGEAEGIFTKFLEPKPGFGAREVEIPTLFVILGE
jgi:predicted nucleotidyltransferase component of viral defense system